jgi:geranylgeranyl diphosphate synthase type II
LFLHWAYNTFDLCASSEQLGKTAGKDVQAAKCTYPAVIGIEKSRELDRTLAREAVEALSPFGPRTAVLHELAATLLQRNR